MNLVNFHQFTTDSGIVGLDAVTLEVMQDDSLIFVMAKVLSM